eukprot:TRINITY_DN4177_c0_g1_i1.p1 TRINITY_DN4177_c0_g1~~TRINITY_DN4177_c0_g1_i1.p1  ORF type:complete len:784 (+),score=234.44 TRINITY_DN4177_c0_g1_i1:298-2649(+)
MNQSSSQNGNYNNIQQNGIESHNANNNNNNQQRKEGEDEEWIKEWLEKGYKEDKLMHLIEVEWGKEKKERRKEERKWLIVTKYRIIIMDATSVKSKGSSKKVKESHLLDMILLDVYPGDQIEMLFRKDNKEIAYHFIAKHEQIPMLVKRIRQSYRQIANNFPESIRPKINLPKNVDILELEPYTILSPVEAYLDTYKAQCLANNIQPSELFCIYLENSISRTNHFDLLLNDCPGMDTEIATEIPLDMLPIMISLRHDRCFKSLMLKDAQRKEIMTLLGDTLYWNTCLTKLVLRNINADSASVQSLCSGLEGNSFHCIAVLDLSDNPRIGNKGVFSLASALKSFNQGLSVLNLNNVGMNGRGIIDLLSGLESNWGLSLSMEYLNLSNNRFDDPSSQMFERWLFLMNLNSSMKRLLLSNCMLTIGLNLETQEALKMLPHLEELDLSRNKFETTSDIELLRSIAMDAPSLKLLNLDYCELGNDWMTLVLNSLAGNSKQNRLNVSIAGNPIEDVSFALPFDAKSHIESVNLSNIHFKESQFINLVQFATKSRLTSLSLDFVFIKPPSDLVSSVLSSFVSNNKFLKSLSLCGGYGRPVIVPLLQKIGEENHSLTSLKITQNRLGDVGAQAISRCLQYNCSLHYLNCDDNQITYIGWQAIESGLKTNTVLNQLEYPSKDLENKPSHKLLQLMMGINSRISKGFAFPADHWNEEYNFPTPMQVRPQSPVPKYLADTPRSTFSPEDRSDRSSGGPLFFMPKSPLPILETIPSPAQRSQKPPRPPRVIHSPP